MLANVNRCKDPKQRFLRHSTQDKNEDSMREALMEMTIECLKEEYAEDFQAAMDREIAKQSAIDAAREEWWRQQAPS